MQVSGIEFNSIANDSTFEMALPQLNQLTNKQNTNSDYKMRSMSELKRIEWDDECGAN